MKEKHIRVRIEQCLALAKASNCPRRKFGALLLDPERNVVLMDGYNGGPRGGGELCGGETCLRDDLKVPSGTRSRSRARPRQPGMCCAAGEASERSAITAPGAAVE
jgi:dCMP deaminase